RPAGQRGGGSRRWLARPRLHGPLFFAPRPGRAQRLAACGPLTLPSPPGGEGRVRGSWRTVMDILQQTDPEVWQAINDERRRQQDGLEMIASENYTSPAVLAAQGSVLTNKYAEGYPGRRYYGGCQHVDVVETLALERVKKLFGAEHANVQPHSGA